MTMLDDKCEVCEVNKPIGVASTLLPLSVAYCAECARRHAQPDIVFECWYDDFGTEFDQMREGFADLIETYKDGKYINYRDWANERKAAGTR